MEYSWFSERQGERKVVGERVSGEGYGKERERSGRWRVEEGEKN